MNHNIEEKALKILNILTENNHESYIVGGYVRDKLLNKKSNDIDICTSATPKEIMKLFPNTSSPNYGSINITYKNSNFDITTFRKEIKYQDNRVPVKMKYIKSIKKDLLRRDFTINTLCMDKNGNILDFLHVLPDLERKQIKTVGNPRYRLKEDALRILRAVRFATILNFDIEEKTKHYIMEYAYLLKKLSITRKKQELDKIFTSPNKEKGIQLLSDLKLDIPLKLPNLENIILCDDLIGIWAQMNVDEIYPFTRLEKQHMKKIRELLNKDIKDKYNIYIYGLYISTVVYQIKKIDMTTLNELYYELPIHSLKEINITGSEIAEILKRKPGNYLKKIFQDIEKKVIDNKLPNEKETLKKYILDNYQGDYNNYIIASKDLK